MVGQQIQYASAAEAANARQCQEESAQRTESADTGASKVERRRGTAALSQNNAKAYLLLNYHYERRFGPRC